MLPHLTVVPHFHVKRPLFCVCFFIYIFYHFPCRKDQFTPLILKFGIEDFINPGSTQNDPADHYWFVFVVLPSQLFLIKGLANFRKENYGVVAQNEGKGIGMVLFFFFFINIIIRQFTILQFLLTLIKRTFSILENRNKKKKEEIREQKERERNS